MRIASGVSDQYIYFAALDESRAPLVGYQGKMVVKRSRNGGALATYTTPTINQTDTGGGGYELLVDEDTTIDAGDFTQEYYVRIKDTGGHMVPIRRTIELFRPGDTGGIADAVYAKGINDTGVYALVDRFDTGVNSRINQFDTGINSRAAQLSNKVDTGVPSSVWDEADAGHTDTGTFGRLRRGVNVSKIDGDTGAADNLGRIAGDTGANSYIPNSIWNALTANHGDTGTFGEELQGISVDFESGLLDLANGVETGLTVRQALRLFSSILGGKVSGAGTSTEVFRNAVADDTDRVTATVDPSGNRVTITLDLS